MVAPSKLYRKPLDILHCSQILLHPGRSCCEALSYNAWHHFLSCSKYFAQLLLTPLTVKLKTLDRELLRDIFKNYIYTVLCGSSCSSIVFFLVCFFRNYFGRFRKYSLIFLPTYLGMQICWFFPKRILQLFATASTQGALEGLFKQYPKFLLSRLILQSKLCQTVVFMLCSGILIHFKRIKKYTGFWFINPINCAEKMGPYVGPYCAHHNNISCRNFILEGIKPFLILGLPLDLYKERNKLLTPQNYRTIRFNTTAFCMSYVTIYRLICCFLSRYKGLETTLQDKEHFAAAFLSGFAYIFMKKTSLCFFAIVLSTQTIWQFICRKVPSEFPHNNYGKLLKLLNSVPFKKILIPINVSFLVHSFIFQNHVVNSLSKGFVNAISANKTQKIHEFLKMSDEQTILGIINTTAVKGYSK